MPALAIAILAHGQISLTFSGTGAASRVDTVKATNLMTGETISLPGTTALVLSNKTGIEEMVMGPDAGIVFPNPASGSATFGLYVPTDEVVALSLSSLDGRLISSVNCRVQAGMHNFDIPMAEAGIYCLSVGTKGGANGYKILNLVNGSGNPICYLGRASTWSGLNGQLRPDSPQLKGAMTLYSLPYSAGDIILMRCKSGIYSTMLTDSPTVSKRYDVEFVGCTDAGANNYPVVKIGIQTWMAENLAYLPQVSPATGGSDGAPFYYVYDYNGSSTASAKSTPNYKVYGALYNWEAAKVSCPTGWHLPTDAEWTILNSYLGSAAGSMIKETGTVHWANPNIASNSTGFTALPGGNRSYPSSFVDQGVMAYMWSSTEGDATHAWVRIIANYDDGFGKYSVSRNRGYSVRCLAGPLAVLPTVTTAEVIAITDSTATGGGNVLSDGGSKVTSRGICWSTSPGPTVLNDRFSGGSGTGVYPATLYGLAAKTKYYVRAYATNSVGTAYGDEKQFVSGGGG